MQWWKSEFTCEDIFLNITYWEEWSGALTSQHLEWAGEGEVEADVHEGGGRHVANGWYIENKRREVLSLKSETINGIIYSCDFYSL